MKIAYVTMQFPVPSETFASLDVETLRKKGHTMEVYGMRPNHANHKQLIKDRKHESLIIKNFSDDAFWRFLSFLTFHPFICFTLLAWVVKGCILKPKLLLKSFILFPSAIFIFSAIYRSRPDIVHLFWGHYPSMIGYLVKRYIPTSKVTMFLGAHDLMEQYPCSIALSRNADVIFTHSRSNLYMMSRLGIDTEDVKVILRGISIDKKTISKDFDSRKPSLLTAARLIEEKGVDDVLKIARSLKSSECSPVLNIAGDGPDLKRLISLVYQLDLSENVVFLGHLRQIELLDMMACSDFFVFMSRYSSERLPNVVKEAMLCECVVVTTDTMGIDELVADGTDGAVVKKGDVSSASDFIQHCLSNPKLIKKYSKEASRTIHEKFNVDRSMNDYISAWESVLNK